MDKCQGVGQVKDDIGRLIIDRCQSLGQVKNGIVGIVWLITDMCQTAGQHKWTGQKIQKGHRKKKLPVIVVMNPR